jgi:acyl dehydratase
MCGYDPSRFKGIAGRFSAPVYPGETIRTEMWQDGSTVSFRARLVERNLVVLNNGKAEIVT